MEATEASSPLNLSDVVHDEPVVDGADPIDQLSRQDSSDESPTPDFDQTANILSSLHNSYAMSEDPSPNTSPQDQEYSVDVLEREIASLLNQNASAASAALLNAAVQQRQSSMDPTRSSPEARGDAVQPITEPTNTINPGLSGLVAVLQAIHARTGPEEDRESMPREQQPTRTAPAFHSLTASDADARDDSGSNKKRRKERQGASEGGRAYLFSEDEQDSDNDTLGRPEKDRSSSMEHQESSPSVSNSILPPVPVPGEFSDLHDILNQFSAQFDPDSAPSPGNGVSTPDASPVISHMRTAVPDVPPKSPAPSTSKSVTVLTPSNRLEEPPEQSTPSSSFATPTQSHYDTGKRPKKQKDKERGPNSHTCEYENCSKTFTRRSDLARHMRIHTGERPFVCTHDGCGKTFIQRSALHVHSRVHTGEKPHCCEYPACGKTFGDSSSLARHRRTHTGKRPYKCQEPNCEKTFTRRTTLTTHMRTHDPDWEPDPNVKYNFKGKKRKLDEEENLEDSVRAISALLQTGNVSASPGSGPNQELPFAEQVASISAEIAAAIAQARSRGYHDEDEDDDEDDEGGEESGSGQELGVRETIGPNTSGIRGLDTVESNGGGPGKESPTEQPTDEDEDSDAFPQPLHTRKSREPASLAVTGTKRKR